MSEDNKNTELWKSVEKTDPKYLKDVKYPFPHKSIDAQYQILKATTLWGAYGTNWGVREETFTPVTIDTKNMCSIIYSATLFYPGGSFSINSDIFMYKKSGETFKVNNDYIKKVSTDAMTKGLSKLGFSGDVFMGGFDGNKYDGIESFVEKEGMTPEQAKTLNGYIKDFEVSNPPKAVWVKKQIELGLTKDMADKGIIMCREIKEGMNK